MVLQGPLGVALTPASPCYGMGHTWPVSARIPALPGPHTPHRAWVLLLSPCFMGRSPENTSAAFFPLIAKPHVSLFQTKPFRGFSFERIKEERKGCVSG